MPTLDLLLGLLGESGAFPELLFCPSSSAGEPFSLEELNERREEEQEESEGRPTADRRRASRLLFMLLLLLLLLDAPLVGEVGRLTEGEAV